MNKLLTNISNWTAVILALPTLLILISWNSSPGNDSFVIKCNLEKIPKTIFQSNNYTPGCTQVLGISDHK